MRKYRKSAALITLVLAILGIGSIGTMQILRQASHASTPTKPAKGFTPDPTRQAMEKDLQKQWLSGKLCNPPCWAGITPGKTTAEEAFELLKTVPEVDNVMRHEDDMHGEFEWDWVNVTNSGGRIFFDVSNSDRVVETILPSITGYFDASVSISEVINVYGEPTHVRVTKYGPTDDYHGHEIPVSYGVEFIWLSQGFAGTSGLGEQSTQLNRDMSMYTLAFFIPSLEGYLNYQGNAGKTLQPWHGFGDVMNYLEP